MANAFQIFSGLGSIGGDLTGKNASRPVSQTPEVTFDTIAAEVAAASQRANQGAELRHDLGMTMRPNDASQARANSGDPHTDETAATSQTDAYLLAPPAIGGSTLSADDRENLASITSDASDRGREVELNPVGGDPGMLADRVNDPALLAAANFSLMAPNKALEGSDAVIVAGAINSDTLSEALNPGGDPGGAGQMTLLDGTSLGDSIQASSTAIGGPAGSDGLDEDATEVLQSIDTSADPNQGPADQMAQQAFEVNDADTIGIKADGSATRATDVGSGRRASRLSGFPAGTADALTMPTQPVVSAGAVQGIEQPSDVTAIEPKDDQTAANDESVAKTTAASATFSETTGEVSPEVTSNAAGIDEASAATKRTETAEASKSVAGDRYEQSTGSEESPRSLGVDGASSRPSGGHFDENDGGETERSVESEGMKGLAAADADDTQADQVSAEGFGGEFLQQDAPSKAAQFESFGVHRAIAPDIPLTPSAAPHDPTSVAQEQVDLLSLEELLVDMPADESVREIGSTLKHVAELSLQRDGAEIQLRLHPAELGDLQIRVIQRDEGVETHIIAAEQPTGELLLQHRDQLMQAFVELGFQTSDVDISFSGHSQKDLSQGSTGDRNSQNQSTRQSTPQISVQEDRPSDSSGGLNIVA